MKHWLNSLNLLDRSSCKAADDGLDSRKDVSLQIDACRDKGGVSELWASEQTIVTLPGTYEH